MFAREQFLEESNHAITAPNRHEIHATVAYREKELLDKTSSVCNIRTQHDERILNTAEHTQYDSPSLQEEDVSLSQTLAATQAGSIKPAYSHVINQYEPVNVIIPSAYYIPPNTDIN